MNEKRILLSDEAPKYKKKSNAKGLPRSKHKHIYETVLLHRKWNGTDFKTGKPKIEIIPIPTKVCTVCGRVSETDMDSKYYIQEKVDGLPFLYNEKRLSKQVEKLEKWYTEDYFDKFATR